MRAETSDRPGAMRTAMPVSEATYLRLVDEDQESNWELHCGRLWSKQPMTWEHSDIYGHLGVLIQTQLSRREFVVKFNAGHVRRSETEYYVPDLIVIPREMARRLFAVPGTVEVYREPLPLVVEVWSPSTGRLDVREKLPEYQRRGDAEIWLIHPYQRTLTAWVRQPDGSYSECRYAGGVVRPSALPGVTIDLDELFNG
jgi:Uma2 family endonuclease